VREVDVLVNGAKKLGIEIEQGCLEKFLIYTELIMKWNKKFNLVGVKKIEDLFQGHFLDSLWCSKGFAMGEVGSLLDLGSGAGLPAIPLKICFPKIHLIMVESQQKRCSFLEEVIKVLGLENCQVIGERSEILAHDQQYREKLDCVTARALAPLNVLLELGIPFLRCGGRLIALKGRAVDKEVASAQYAFKKLGARLETIIPYCFEGETGRHVVVICKEAQTPDIYPRKPGIPAKRPLVSMND
jgi:16S rRNA (guanine527-N7)-methyltransferase